jgi:nicotinate-nucleotide pyrophosphorylase (carboxylating)
MILLNFKNKLVPGNKDYEKALDLYVWGGYRLDTANGDPTTKYFPVLPAGRVAAQIISHSNGILAGLEEAEWFLKKCGIIITRSRSDGEHIRKNEVVMQITADAASILLAERTLLNLIQRMSGIASLTRRMTLKISKDIQLLATRKTYWGPLDKKAVACGGGGTHRIHLGDGILIKDNHLVFSKTPEKAFKKLFKKAAGFPVIEVELESLDEVIAFVEMYQALKAEANNRVPLIVLLDNFMPKVIKEAVPALSDLGIGVEVSGGVTEANISDFNIKGVTAISSSALTTSALPLDMSLSFVHP